MRLEGRKMTTAEKNPHPGVLPPRGTAADDWSDNEVPYRVVWGSARSVTVGRPSREGLTMVCV